MEKTIKRSEFKILYYKRLKELSYFKAVNENNEYFEDHGHIEEDETIFKYSKQEIDCCLKCRYCRKQIHDGYCNYKDMHYNKIEFRCLKRDSEKKNEKVSPLGYCNFYEADVEMLKYTI